MRRSPEFYQVRVVCNKVLWRGMELTHIKDLSPEQRNDILNEIRRLKEQGFGRNRIQKEIARSRSVYVPEGIIRRADAGEEIDWERCGIRGSYEDLGTRELVYKRVRELCSEGKSYRQVQEAVQQEFGIHLSKSHISYWCRDVHRPFCSVKEVALTPHAWYLIGLLVADGNIDVHYDDSYRRYRVELAVRDKELIKEAIRVAGGHTSYRRDGRIRLTIKSRELYDILQRVRSLIKERRFDKLLEMMDKDGTKAFLKGFFDGDGSGLFPQFINADLNILEFVRYALNHVGIRTSEPVLSTMKGTVAYNPAKHQWIVRKRDVYIVFVYPEDYQRFFEEVGTTLERKIYQWKLSEEMLRRHSTRLERTPLDEIKRRYENGENWTEILVMLLKSVGAKTMKKRRKTPTPSFSPLLILIS